MSAPKKKSWAGKLVNSFLGKQKSDRSIGDKNRTSIPHRNLPARSDSEANFQRSTAVPKSSRAVSNVSRRRRNYSDRVKEADQEQAQDCSLESDNTVTNDKITYSSSRSNSEKTDKIMTDELYHSSLSPRPQFSPKKKSTTTTAIKGQNDMKQSEGPGTFETEAPTEEASSNDTSFRNSSTTASDDRVNILTTNTAPTGTHPLEFSQVNTFLLRPVNQSGDDDGSERDPGLTDSRRAATLFEGKESGRSNEFDALSDSSGSIDLVAVANNVTTPLDRPPIEESGSSIQVCSVRLKGSSPASDAGETNQESNSSAVDVCKARDIYPATNSWRLSSSCEESDVSIMSSPLSHSDEESQSDRDPLQLEDFSSTDICPPASKDQRSAGTRDDIGGDSSNVSVSVVDNSEGSATAIPSDTVVDDKTHEDTTPLARHVDSNVSKDDSRDVPTAYSDTDTSPPASKNQHSAGTIGDIGGDSSNVSVSVVDTSEGSATAIPSDTVVDDKTYEVSVFLAKHNASKGLKDDSRDIPFSYTDTSFSTQHRAGATCDIDDAQSSPEVLDELHDLQSSSGSELSSIFNHVVDSQNKSIILPHKVTNDDGTAPFTNCDEEIENYFRLGGLVATKASFTRRRECTTSQAKTSEAASLVDKGSNSMHRSRRHHLGADIGRGNTLCAVTTTMARLEHADPISLYFYLGSVYAGVGVKHTIDASKGDCPMLLDVEE